MGVICCGDEMVNYQHYHQPIWHDVEGKGRGYGGGGYCYSNTIKCFFVKLYLLCFLFKALKKWDSDSCFQNLHFSLLPLYTAPSSSPSIEATGPSCEVLRVPSSSSTGALLLHHHSTTSIKEPWSFSVFVLKPEASWSQGWKSLFVEQKSRQSHSPFPSEVTEHQR